MSKIDLESKIQEIHSKPWDPIEVAKVNDQVVRLALMKGEYHWHQHADEDELFYVISGTLIIQMKEADDIILKTGEMAVVTKGTDHCPKSENGAYVLMFEPQVLKSKGN